MLHFTSLPYLLGEETQVGFGSGTTEAWGGMQKQGKVVLAAPRVPQRYQQGLQRPQNLPRPSKGDWIKGIKNSGKLYAVSAPNAVPQLLPAWPRAHPTVELS